MSASSHCSCSRCSRSSRSEYPDSNQRIFVDLKSKNLPHDWFPTNQNVNMFDHVRKLERDYECLQAAFLSLSTQFARMQFRFHQVMEAEPHEREAMLRDMEEYMTESISGEDCMEEVTPLDADIRAIGDIRQKQILLLNELRSKLCSLVEVANDMEESEEYMDDFEEDDEELYCRCKEVLENKCGAGGFLSESMLLDEYATLAAACNKEPFQQDPQECECECCEEEEEGEEGEQEHPEDCDCGNEAMNYQDECLTENNPPQRNSRNSMAMPTMRKQPSRESKRSKSCQPQQQPQHQRSCSMSMGSESLHSFESDGCPCRTPFPHYCQPSHMSRALPKCNCDLCEKVIRQNESSSSNCAKTQPVKRGSVSNKCQATKPPKYAGWCSFRSKSQSPPNSQKECASKRQCPKPEVCPKPLSLSNSQQSKPIPQNDQSAMLGRNVPQSGSPGNSPTKPLSPKHSSSNSPTKQQSPKQSPTNSLTRQQSPQLSTHNSPTRQQSPSSLRRASVNEAGSCNCMSNTQNIQSCPLNRGEKKCTPSEPIVEDQQQQQQQPIAKNLSPRRSDGGNDNRAALLYHQNLDQDYDTLTCRRSDGGNDNRAALLCHPNLHQDSDTSSCNCCICYNIKIEAPNIDQFTTPTIVDSADSKCSYVDPYATEDESDHSLIKVIPK